MDKVFNMDISTIEAVHLEKETAAGGPPYDVSTSTSNEIQAHLQVQLLLLRVKTV